MNSVLINVGGMLFVQVFLFNALCLCKRIELSNKLKEK